MCMAGNLAHLITCEKFQDEFLRVTILQKGVYFPILPRCMECRRGLAMRILSVSLYLCPSVRLTHAWIVTKR